MVSKDSKIFVSTNKFEYGNVQADQIEDNKKDYFALSMNTKFQAFNFVPFDQVTRELYTGQAVKVCIENSQGTQYNLMVSPKCEFITKRGNIKASKVNELDVFIDSKNLLCKLISKEITDVKNHPMMSISCLYTVNFFCNDVLVKNNQ